MRRAPRATSLATLALSTVMAACGGSADPAQAAAEIEALLPDDYTALVRIASLDRITAQVAQVAEAAGEDPKSVDARDALALAGPMFGNVRQIDTRLPIVIAASTPRGKPPTVVALVPAKDTRAFATSLPAGASPATEGTYVSVPLYGDYQRPAAAGKLPTNLPDTAIAIDADMAALAQTFGPVLGAGLAGARAQIVAGLEDAGTGLDGAEVASLLTDFLTTMLESGEHLRIGVDMPDGRLDVATTLTAKPGSALDGWSSPPVDVDSLARGVGGDGPMELVLAADWTKVWPRYEEIFDRVIDIYPEAARDRMRRMMSLYSGVMEAAGQGMVGKLDVYGEQGMRMDIAMAPKDADALMQGFEDVIKSPALAELGLTNGRSERSNEDGVRLMTTTAELDHEKLLAFTQSLGEAPDASAPATTPEMMQQMLGDSLATTLAVRGDRAGMALGGDHAARAREMTERTDGQLSEATRAGLARVADCNPMFVERIDMGHMMAQAMAMAQATGREADSVEPCDLVFYFGVAGSEWRLGGTVDVIGMTTMMSSRGGR